MDIHNGIRMAFNHECTAFAVVLHLQVDVAVKKNVQVPVNQPRKMDVELDHV